MTRRVVKKGHQKDLDNDECLEWTPSYIGLTIIPLRKVYTRLYKERKKTFSLWPLITFAGQL